MMTKIKDFMLDNWSEVIIVGAVIVGEIAVCSMYKGYLNRCEDK